MLDKHYYSIKTNKKPCTITNFKRNLIAVALLSFNTSVLAIGEGPNHTHIEQSQIESGELSTAEIVKHGQLKFTTDFNRFDGHGDPERPGVNGVGVSTGFNRISGTDSVACTACHSKPFVGGASDNAANIFPGFNRPDNIDSPSFEGLNVKNSQSVFGGGAKQRIAEEMNAELAAIANEAIEFASDLGDSFTLPLVAKGISFGEITALADGTLDTSGVEGVSTDLVIRPFNVVGAEPNLRSFVVGAMEQHFGIEAEERFGLDGDGDGVERELTVGDVTATALFQAALPIPTQVIPKKNREVRRAIFAGEKTFNKIGCASCHTPEMKIDDPVFQQTAPGTDFVTTLDLTRDSFVPRLRRNRDGSATAKIYSDLKRHDMGAELAEPLLQVDRASTSHFVTSQLWGVASTGPWLHDGRATTLTDAILLHGGEADASSTAFESLSEYEQAEVIEFLKSLQIVIRDPRLIIPNLPLGQY
ncbi:di-heme oxidoredictase family protein [Sessilibacter corallicola]|uniref:Cytochrome c domain-containing protein n=1 Tax=Sessilibacter corallicola TaxID=2904075 RepID=A0ABQ0A6X8_9GAMM